jgi:Lanthionine synthetase C-like protein
MDVRSRQERFVEDFLSRIDAMRPEDGVFRMRGMRCGADGVAYALRVIARASASRRAGEIAVRFARLLHELRPGLPFPENDATYARMVSHSDAACLLSEAVAGDEPRAAAAAFVDAAREADAAPGDFVIGTAGWLHAAVTVEALARRWSDGPLLERSAAVTDRFRDRLADEIRGPLAERLNDSFAHGWPGVLYALLSAAAVRGATADAFDVRAVRALHERTVDAGNRRRLLGGANVPAGWCDGSAGHLYLWLRAWRTTGEEAYEDRARDAAFHCGSALTSRRSGLCCGLAGQAVALAHFAQVTRDATARARANAVAALSALRPTNVPAEYRESLMLGRAGVAVLQAHVLAERVPHMPFLWPSAGTDAEETQPIPVTSA